MINTSGFLANTKVTVKRKASQTKTRTGGVINVVAAVYVSIDARIEHQEVETPITISGKLLRDFYLMQTWKNPSGDLYELKDGDVVEELNGSGDVHKAYEIVDVQGGSLFKNKKFKLESKMLVMNDDRYQDFIQKN